jgi:dTDP-4-amino-4,6-dideoxygalactose transaminase
VSDDETKLGKAEETFAVWRRPDPAGEEPATIPFQRPSLPPAPEIERYLDLAREERWFSNGGPCWRLLRDRLSDRVGAYCVPVASGTLGLMVAIASVLETPGVGPKRGAVMPSFTFVATAQAAIWAGLEPRLSDIAPDHWHLDAAMLEDVLRDGDDLGAVLAVSAFGTPPPAEARIRWERACRGAGVPLIVDSAAGFGAVGEDGVPVGAQGDVEVVSFHATKPFAVGEGGAVFTRDRDLHERIELAVNFGLRPDRTMGFGHGLNAKMSELHAATGLAVLDRLDSILEQRRHSAASLRERAAPGVSWQAGCELSTWQFLPVALSGSEQRERVIEACRDQIEVRVYYEPLGQLIPECATAAGADLTATNAIHGRVLCLPMANDLSPVELDTIASVLEVA